MKPISRFADRRHSEVHMSNTTTVGVPGAAEILHVHPKTVEELIRDGSIPAGKVGRSWVMMTRDVLAYAEKIIISQTAERLAAKRTRKITKEPRRLKG